MFSGGFLPYSEAERYVHLQVFQSNEICFLHPKTRTQLGRQEKEGESPHNVQELRGVIWMYKAAPNAGYRPYFCH